MQFLSQNQGVTLDADTSSRGNLAFCVEAKNNVPETEQFLKYTADFLRTGFSSLAREFPENISFTEAVQAGI